VKVLWLVPIFTAKMLDYSLAVASDYSFSPFGELRNTTFWVQRSGKPLVWIPWQDAKDQPVGLGFDEHVSTFVTSKRRIQIPSKAEESPDRLPDLYGVHSGDWTDEHLPRAIREVANR
jgi:hypothetical protein